MDTNQLRFLESIENIRALTVLRTGREISSSRAREITSCIQQGRLFFETAEESPLEIRPLIQFYGALGFAKAIVLGHQLRAMATMSKGHGLRDVSTPGARITELAARVENQGTFAEFNDSMAALNRVRYIDAETHPASAAVEAAPTATISAHTLTLRDVLSRTPGLSKLYRSTFSEPSLSESLDVLYYSRHDDYWTIRLVDDERFDSRDSLKAIVIRWRDRFPYLEKWRVIEASPAWGASYITLANLDRSEIDDLDAENLVENEPSHYTSAARGAPPANLARLPLAHSLPGVGSGPSGEGLFAIAPVGTAYLSEFSLAYVGLFLLSSLVRYRPDTWTHSLSRTALQDRPVDDQAIALVHAFLEQSQTIFPSLVVRTLNPSEDRYA